MNQNNPPSNVPKKSNTGKIILIISGILLLCFLIIGFIVYRQVFPKQLTPVSLTKSEAIQLKDKVNNAGFSDLKVEKNQNNTQSNPEDIPTPKPYTENEANRVLKFSQKELNALIAANSDLANKIAVHLSSDTISLNAVIPMDKDVPILGGKNLKATAGIEVGMNNDQPKIIIKGVSVWGIPVPSAWMGGLKNVDIAKEIQIKGSNSEGQLSKGIKYIEIKDGHLIIELNK